MAAETRLANQVTALAAGVATDLVGVGTTGIDVSEYQAVSIQINNPSGVGQNPLTSLVVQWSNDPTGLLWGQDNSVSIPGGSWAAQANGLLVLLDPVEYLRMRIVATSTVGTSITLNLFARDKSGSI